MNKAELIKELARKSGLFNIQAEDVMESFTELVMERLKEGKEVTITGFGTFSARKRSARMGVDPRDPKKRIEMPEIIVPKFKAGKTLKDYLKK